jgi:cation transport regulator
MPYRTNSDLPASVQEHLPPHAQDIYCEAFNHAFAVHAGDPRQDEAARRIAWAAVKRSYVRAVAAGSAAPPTPYRFSGLMSSPRSGSPHPAKMTPRTASRSCTVEAKSLPAGAMGCSKVTLIGLHLGNH